MLKACQQKFDIASHALEYLGTEPAEPFWMPVRQHILEELRNLVQYSEFAEVLTGINMDHRSYCKHRYYRHFGIFAAHSLV